MSTTPKDHLTNAPDAMIVFDADGAISWTNTAAAALFGYSLDTFLGLPMGALVPHRLRAEHASHHERYRDAPRPAFMGDRFSDLVALRSDGSEFLAEISLSPVGRGHDLSVLTVIRDITPRRAAEIDNETIRLALDSVAEAVFMFDSRTFTLWYANSAGRRQIGLGPTDFSAEVSFLEVSNPTGNIPLGHLLEPLVKGDRALVTYDALHSPATDSPSEVEVLVQRVEEIPFGRDSLIALARDTTERKRHEQALAVEAEWRNHREAQLALAEERERIARRLQDNVIQRLFAVGIRLQATGSDPGRLESAADAAIIEIDNCISEVRDTIFTLEER